MKLAFSPLQQRYLDALGYTLYALAGTEAGAPVRDPVPDARESHAYPPGNERTPNIAPVAAEDERDSALFVAVLRAARVQIDSVPDPREWLIARGVDSIASLRADPAAKRALWPMLRRERRAP